MMQSIDTSYRDKHHRCKWCKYRKYHCLNVPNIPDYEECVLKKKIIRQHYLSGIFCQEFKADYSDLQNI